MDIFKMSIFEKHQKLLKKMIHFIHFASALPILWALPLCYCFELYIHT